MDMPSCRKRWDGFLRTLYGKMKGKGAEKMAERKRFGENIGDGKAVVLVKGSRLGDESNPFWAWLREEGFRSWGYHGNYGCDWVFINLNSMVYAPGVPGIRITFAIREHAITMDEFRTIWEIYRKYDGFGPLVMPEHKPGEKEESILGEDATSRCN